MAWSPSARVRSAEARGVLRSRVAVLACAVGALVAGCGGAPPPDAGWPAGVLLSGSGAALRDTLERLAALGQTPLARSAQALRDALPDCQEVEARAPTLGALAAALRCAAGDGEASALAGLRAWRGEADLALALPVGAQDAPRLLARARLHAGELHVALRWPGAGGSDALAALLPGASPAGPGVLSDRDPLLHARVRAEGPLDLSALVPAGSQGDQLFRLKGELFGATVLDGTWELALYPPRPDAKNDPAPLMPAVALALGVRSPAAAEAAADALLRDVEAHWSVERTPLHWGEHAGACLLSLNLLPALAPCELVTPRALVLAWNPPSLARALEGAPGTDDPATARLAAAAPLTPPPVPDPLAGAPGTLRIDLAALHAVDRRLAARVGDAAAAPVDWPWRRIVALGGRRDGALAIDLAFEGAALPVHTSGDGS